jgi:hypothetical protein
MAPTFCAFSIRGIEAVSSPFEPSLNQSEKQEEKDFFNKKINH